MAEEVTRETFDMFKTLTGRAYPEKDIIVYTNEAKIHELNDIRKELQVQTSNKTKAYKELEKRAEEVSEEIKDSALIFHLRGVAPGVTGILVEKYQREEKDWAGLQDELLSATLVKVTNADGKVDERKFSIEECAQIRNILPQAGYEQLAKTITELNMSGAIYDAAVDSGFLQKP